MKDTDRYRYVTRSVERALTILHLFVVGEAEIGLSDISGRVGLHQSTVFRLLATLSASGFTEQSAQTGRYRLGPAALSLGQAFLRHSDLRQIAEAPWRTCATTPGRPLTWRRSTGRRSSTWRSSPACTRSG